MAYKLLNENFLLCESEKDTRDTGRIAIVGPRGDRDHRGIVSFGLAVHPVASWSPCAVPIYDHKQTV